jgi:hypothetical protein
VHVTTANQSEVTSSLRLILQNHNNVEFLGLRSFDKLKCFWSASCSGHIYLLEKYSTAVIARKIKLPHKISKRHSRMDVLSAYVEAGLPACQTGRGPGPR